MSFLKLANNPFETAAQRWATATGPALESTVVASAAVAAQGLVAAIRKQSSPIEEWDAFRGGVQVYRSPTNVWVGLDDEDASTVLGVEYGEFEVEGDVMTAASMVPPRPIMQPSINATRVANQKTFEAQLKQRMFG